MVASTRRKAPPYRLTRGTHRMLTNPPPIPGVFPDYSAPVVRNDGGEPEMLMMRWGMPPPPRTGGAPSPTFATSSPHRRGWLMPESRCLVPANSFAEHAPEPNPETKGRTWCGSRSTRTGPCSRSLVSGLSSRASGALSRNRSPAASRLWLPDRLRRAQANQLRHAALYITELLKTEHDAEWRAATEALVLITKGGGPMAMARIGMMQDAALQIADAVQTTKIGRRPKSPVMLLGPESYFD
jgi:hypothetical protein